MTMLYIILGLMFLIACRYVPGFKCVTFCFYKKYKAMKALDDLRKITIFKNNFENIILSIDDEHYSLKQLDSIYKNTFGFGCRQNDFPNWVYSAREILKNRIAERHLLES